MGWCLSEEATGVWHGGQFVDPATGAPKSGDWTDYARNAAWANFKNAFESVHREDSFETWVPELRSEW